MNTKLTQIANSAEEKDCELMLDELLSFGSEPLSEDEQNDIISRVTRKAETEMTQTKPKKKIKRKLIAFLVAAAILLPTGAYAAGKLFHKENVEFYLKGSERIEQNESAVKNYVMENEDYRLTIDSQLSDGHNVMQIVTQEAKNSDARASLESFSGGLFSAKAQYADGSDGPHFDNYWDMFFSCAYAFGEHAKTSDSQVVLYSCNDIDTQKDIKLSYYIPYEAYSSADTNTEENNTDYKKLDGFEYTSSFAPNVKSVELKSKDGNKLILSEFELYRPDGKNISKLLGDEERGIYHNLTFIRNNGEKYNISKENNSDVMDDYIIFGEIINVYDFKGVEINGVEYLK